MCNTQTKSTRDLPREEMVQCLFRLRSYHEPLFLLSHGTRHHSPIFEDMAATTSAPKPSRKDTDLPTER